MAASVKLVMGMTDAADVFKEKGILHRIAFRSDVDQTAVWQQALHQVLPADFHLQAWPSTVSKHSVNGNGRSPNGNGRAPHLASPSLLLHLTDLSDWDKIAQQHQEQDALPVIYAGPRGSHFQIGPGVIAGQTACPACLQQQTLLFPGIVAVTAETNVFLADQTIARLAARLMVELAAFMHHEADSLLRRGYLLRQRAGDDSWQVYRGLRNPYCEICSLYAQYPSEAVYIK